LKASRLESVGKERRNLIASAPTVTEPRKSRVWTVKLLPARPFPRAAAGLTGKHPPPDE
jgi:hypothetical protein